MNTIFLNNNTRPTVQSLTALNSSLHSSFNSLEADGTWLYFLVTAPGEDLKKETKKVKIHNYDKKRHAINKYQINIYILF